MTSIETGDLVRVDTIRNWFMVVADPYTPLRRADMSTWPYRMMARIQSDEVRAYSVGAAYLDSYWFPRHELIRVPMSFCGPVT